MHDLLVAIGQIVVWGGAVVLALIAILFIAYVRVESCHPLRTILLSLARLVRHLSG